MDEMEDLAALVDMEIRELVNPRSTVFRRLDLDIGDVNPEKAAEILLDNPRIMYRPLFSDGKRLVVGFKPEEMRELL